LAIPNMIEFVNFLVEAIIIYFVIKVLLDVVAWFFLQKFRDELQEIKEARSIEDNTLMVLDTSRHEDTILCHDAKTGDFVCQGKTMSEISKNFTLRYPDKNVIIQGDKEIIDTLKNDKDEILA